MANRGLKPKGGRVFCGGGGVVTILFFLMSFATLCLAVLGCGMGKNEISEWIYRGIIVILLGIVGYLFDRNLSDFDRRISKLEESVKDLSTKLEESVKDLSTKLEESAKDMSTRSEKHNERLNALLERLSRMEGNLSIPKGSKTVFGKVKSIDPAKGTMLVQDDVGRNVELKLTKDIGVTIQTAQGTSPASLQNVTREVSIRVDFTEDPQTSIKEAKAILIYQSQEK